MNKKKMKKYFFIVITFLIVLFIAVGDSHAYTSSNAGKNDFDTSGGFYFEIKGGSNGNSRIHFQFKRLSGATSYNNMMSATSKWSVSTVSSNTTNKHNVQIVDTSINTKLDITDSYNVLSFRITYDMPAHYQYSSFSADSPSGMRFNMSEYSYDGSGANSAATNGYHSENTTRRTVNIQVNTGNTGLRTYGKYWYYNCTLSLNIAKADRVVTFTDGLGTILKTQNVVDSSYATAPTNPTRTGYTFIGWDKEYSVICSNTTVNAKWNINTYSIFYVLNGGSISNQSTSYTVVNAVNIPNPIRNGFEFLGWTGSNGIIPQKNVSIPVGSTGNKTYTASWKALIPPVITAPIANFDKIPWDDKICNQLVILQGNTFDAIDYVSAHDIYDGDITERIKVIQNTVPLNEGIANTLGEFYVTYEVTNSNNLKTIKQIKIFVNDIPKVSHSDRYLINNNTLTYEMILSKTFIIDKYDSLIYQGKQVSDETIENALIQIGAKDVSSLMHVSFFNVSIFDMDNQLIDSIYSQNDIQRQINNLNNEKYKIVLKIVDSHKGEMTSSFFVNLVDNELLTKEPATRYSRYISDKGLSSLMENSIWKTNVIYNSILKNSINNITAIKTIKFTKESINEIKNNISNPSKNANEDFMNRYLRR